MTYFLEFDKLPCRYIVIDFSLYLLDNYHEGDYNLDSTSLSATPTNSLPNDMAFSNSSSRPMKLDPNIEKSESDETKEKENDENDVVSEDISFKQRQEMAKTTRRKKKKTNSSLVATTFKELYQLTGNYYLLAGLTTKLLRNPLQKYL